MKLKYKVKAENGIIEKSAIIGDTVGDFIVALSDLRKADAKIISLSLEQDLTSCEHSGVTF
jgi:hypothetical protein